MEPQKTPNSQRNLKKEQSVRYHAAWHQTVLKNYNNQNNMVLEKKQIHTSMEENSKPPNKSLLTGQLIYDTGGKETQWSKDSLVTK